MDHHRSEILRKLRLRPARRGSTSRFILTTSFADETFDHASAFEPQRRFKARPVRQGCNDPGFGGALSALLCARSHRRPPDGTLGAGLGGARPDFRYDASVRNVLPQSVMAGLSIKAHRKWLIGLQSNWIGWRNAFASLPVTLTHGNNSDINGLIGADSIFDRVPLHWKNQISYRAGVEHQVAEGFLLRAGYAQANSAVPASTLSPLTAAILTRQYATGFGYQRHRIRFDVAYTLSPMASQSVASGGSALRNGEYANSRVRIGLQGFTLNTSYQF